MADLNIFQKLIKTIYNKLGDDLAKMLIVTGAIGYILSSAAQCFGILFNNKLPQNEKNYLFAQEFYDGIVNVIGFLAVTTVCKNVTNKLFKTGKISTKSVKNYLNKKDIKPNFDVNLDDFIKDAEIKKSYESNKALYTTIATIGGGVLSSSVLTPIVRNKKAANFCEYQRDKEANKPNISYNPTITIPQNNMKI